MLDPRGCLSFLLASNNTFFSSPDPHGFSCLSFHHWSSLMATFSIASHSSMYSCLVKNKVSSFTKHQFCNKTHFSFSLSSELGSRKSLRYHLELASRFLVHICISDEIRYHFWRRCAIYDIRCLITLGALGRFDLQDFRCLNWYIAC